MNAVKFREPQHELNLDIVYCIIDNTSLYTNESARATLKNIADWTVQNITANGYTVFVGTDEDTLLKEASEYFRYAVVLNTGTEFVNGDTFFNNVKKVIEEDFFLMGHVLDRGDAYYELHQQCYIINLRQYRKLGCPEIGKQELCSTHVQDIPYRSEENFHDNYTPLWVQSGDKFKEYNHKCHGWNILSLAFEKEYDVLVFSEHFRNNKKHYYPEFTDSYATEINFIYKRNAFCSGLAIYPFNSDPLYVNKIPGPIEQLVVPAAGLNWLWYLGQYGFNENTVIKFYDYSLPALEFMKKLMAWDGKDYPAFATSLIKNKFEFLENGNEIPFCGPQDLEQEYRLLSMQFNMDALWSKVRELKVEFHWRNILDSSEDITWINQYQNTFINVSNIFSYIGTAATHSVGHRVDAENKFLLKLKDRVPDAYIGLRRAASGYIDDKTIWPAQVKDVPLTNINRLIKPTWRSGHDWC